MDEPTDKGRVDINTTEHRDDGRQFSAPAGKRVRRVDPQTAAELAGRPDQTQIITYDNQLTVPFERAQFVAHMNNEMRFMRNGDLVITLVVPYEFKHLAMSLSNAFGLPLSVDVELWEPYRQELG